MNTHKIGISLSIIGVAAVLMVVTAPTLENHLAIAVTQPMVKKVSTKDPPSKPVVKKYPVRKVRKVLRCGLIRGKRVCRWVYVFSVRGPRIQSGYASAY
jgi:hypothetical protein